MTTMSAATERPLLDWALCRGRAILNFQLQAMGNQFVVSVLAPGQGEVYARKARGTRAFQLHAALVAGFREAGWNSIEYTA